MTNLLRSLKSYHLYGNLLDEEGNELLPRESLKTDSQLPKVQEFLAGKYTLSENIWTTHGFDYYAKTRNVGISPEVMQQAIVESLHMAGFEAMVKIDVLKNGVGVAVRA